MEYRITNEYELEDALENMTKKIIECYKWERELPTSRFVDYSMIAEDFEKIVESAFDNL